MWIYGKTDGKVSWRRESARKGPNTTSIAQFAALPLVKPVVWFSRPFVKWRSRSIAKSAYLLLSNGLQKFLRELKSEIWNTQKTTEIISYNRWINWHKPWIGEANK